MDVGESLIGQVLEAISDIDIEAAKRADKVDDLHEGVRLVANVVRKPFHKGDEGVTADPTRHFLQHLREHVPEQDFEFCKDTCASLINADEEIEEGHAKQDDSVRQKYHF